MQSFWLRLLGHSAARHALRGQTRPGGALDIQLGLALLRDRRVPIAAKLLALALGAAGMALLIALELPAETLIALFLPAIGFVADITLDGLEGVVGPFILAALLLPHLAPKPLVEMVRYERGLQAGTAASG